MADDRMFAPLPGAGQRRKATPAADPWRPILPVPDDAPLGTPPHRRRGKPSGCWTYRDPAGNPLGYVLRFDQPDGSKEFLPATYCENTATGAREWRFKAWLPPRPLYGLDRLAERPTKPVVIVEGEKAADAAVKLLPDHVAVTSPNGAKSAAKADWRALTGRDVILWPDNDDEGRGYAAAVVRALRGIAALVKIASAPAGVAEKWDAADALAEGWDQAKAAALIAAAVAADGASSPASAVDARGDRRRRPQSADLLDLVGDAELWHSADREAYATIRVAGHFENWPVRSKDFREWLSSRYFERTGGAPGSQATEDALRVLEGRAKHDGPEHPVFLRIGEHDGAVFIDLGDAQWRAVRVTVHGWDVIERAPVKFTRSNAMRPLPVPEAGGRIEAELRDLVNVRDEADFKLIAAFIVGCFNPRGPYPMLAVSGEQGSGKTSIVRLVRSLVDPAAAPVRSPPRDEQSLINEARSSWLLAFDNLSEIPNWLSDALCRLSTGGGFSARELYSDTGQIVFEGTRPIVLNGIPDLGSRPDFADRIIHVVLKPIAGTQRRTEREIGTEAEGRRALIFGAILDAVAGALRNRDAAPPPVTRMADFETWICGAERALGWETGEFIAAYLGNRKGAIEATLEADPLSEAVRQLVEKEDWSGSPTELLARLAEKVTDTVCKSRAWPAANKLRGRLRRLQAPLRQKGILLDLDERANDAARTRVIDIHRDRSGEPS